MVVRSDMDAYPRGCKRLENWELSPEGGIKRRGGLEVMSTIGLFQESEPGKDSARVFPYVYTMEGGQGGRYVVVVSRYASWLETIVSVHAPSGETVAYLSGGHAESAEKSWKVWLPELGGMRAKQVNSLLYLLAPNERPWVLKRDSAGVWTLEAWKFKSVPWRHTPGEDRDEGLLLRMGRDSSGVVDRKGAWYTASDSGRVGGESISVPASLIVPSGTQEYRIGEKISGSMMLALYYGPPKPDSSEQRTYTVVTASRTLHANAVAVAEADSSLGSGIAPPTGESISVPGIARYFSPGHQQVYSMRQNLRVYAALPAGGELTLYLICEGQVQVEGLSDLEVLWAGESGQGFTESACPGGSNRLHLVRVKGKLTGTDVYIRNIDSFLWCGAHAVQGDSARTFELDFAQVTEEGEQAPALAAADEDYLRVSYQTEQREAHASEAELLNGVQVIGSAYNQTYTAVHALPAGSKVAFLEHAPDDCPEEIYSCIADYNVQNLYIKGLDSPANYTGNFVKSTRQSIPSGETPIRLFGMNEASGTITKGKYVALVMQGWRYYTVRKAIAEGQEFPQGPDNSPDYFAKGLICGAPLPCRGAWSTYTSGVWYGEYAVKRNYDTVEPLGEGWETAGRTVSRIGSPTNKLISGDEAGEECHLALWLLGSRCMDADMTDLSAGFPGDSCENRLIVESYRRDLVFKLVAQEDGSTSWATTDGKLPEWEGEKRIMDWSWWAFSPRYGGPTCCDVYAQRLVFAGTHGQPQTLWASKTDDLDNFAVGSDDADALELTLATTSQNPICWIQAKGDILLLGTSECEYSVSSRAGGAFTASTAVARPQSYIGSANSPCIQADNRVLFLQRGGRRLYEIGYDFETDGYISRDLSLLAAHIGREHQGFQRGALAKVPYTTAYIVLGDGQLALLSYNPLENIKGWHRWLSACGPFTDVCVLPGEDGDDQIYLLQIQTTGSQLQTFWYFCLLKLNPSKFHDERSGSSVAYTSVLTTLPLNNISTQSADNQSSAAVKICLGADCGGGIQLSKDEGAHYFPPDRHYPLAAGWHDLKAPTSWRVDDTITIQSASTTYGLHILALQG